MGGFTAPRVKRPGVDVTRGRSWGTMEDPAGAPPTGVMVGGPTGGTPKVSPGMSTPMFGPVGGGGGEDLATRRARMRRQRMGPGGGMEDLGTAEGPVTPPPPSPLLAAPQAPIGTAPPPSSPNAGGVFPRIVDAMRQMRMRQGGPAGIIGRLRNAGVLGGGSAPYGATAGPGGPGGMGVGPVAGGLLSSPWGRTMGGLRGLY